MKLPAFPELADAIKAHEIQELFLYPALWKNFDFKDFDVSNAVWSGEIKYLNDKGDDCSKEIKNLPNKSGGIYCFFIKCHLLPSLANYLVYIGRAQITKNQNLRKRCKTYLSEWTKPDGRAKIQMMFHKWSDSLFVKYLELNDNDQIVRLEASLVNSIMPPFNDMIPDKRIHKAINAF